MQFSTSIINDDSRIYSTVDLLYPTDIINTDTIDCKWGSFIFSFNPQNKRMHIYQYEGWNNSRPIYIYDNHELDFQYQKAINDSVWLFGGKINIDHKSGKVNYSLDKFFFYFIKKKDDTKFSFDSNHIIKFKYDSIVTFKGEPMNEENRMYPYDLKFPYLFFNESPFIYNINKNMINLNNLSRNITWIFDMQIRNNIIHILVKENKDCVLYTLLKSNNNLLMRETLCVAEPKSNIILDDNHIYYMNKSGELIIVGVNY